MNLYNFDQQVDPAIINRGHNYFLNDFADKPQQVKQGVWKAKVYGTHMYHVEITADPENHEEIETWSCNCPYDYGPVCKHVAAVLYAIREDEKSAPDGFNKRKSNSPDKKRQKIFNKLTQQDLQEFIKDCFKTVDGLENRFLAYFADRLDEEPEQKYRTIINNYIRAAEGPHGFIDYEAAYNLTQPLYELNEKADELLYSSNIRECLVLCQTLIEEVAETAGFIDQAAVGVEDTIYSAFNTLFALIEKAPPNIKDELFEWCLQEMTHQKYSDYGFESNFLYLLPELVSSQEQEERFFALLDRRIAHAKKSQYSDYGVTLLVKAKIDYLQHNNREEEVIRLLQRNVQFYEFRSRLIDHSLNNSDFEQAKKLCRGGLEQAKKKNRWGNGSRWKGKLYQIAEMEEDLSAMRKWAEELYFKGYNIQWYQALKDTYSNVEWPGKCEELLSYIKGTKQRGGYRKGNAMADIFIEEGYKKRLLKLLQLNDENFTFILQYAGELSDEYPHEILDFYEKGIKEYARSTGRKRYRQIADWLKDMKQMTGGDERAYSLFKRLLQKYNNRPAMKDEFYKVFPNWKGAV
jgi:uncharacterized Zn finger protein